jgi:hypothetical protein
MFDYGFDKLSNKLYEALTAYPPDFKLAQQYINEGADIHARSKNDDDENILAQIILGYPHVDDPGEDLSQEESIAYWRRFDGRYLPEIVHFFLENGFDVTLDNQKFGADCLRNLTWSSYDHFILDATKLLLKAGASYSYEDDEHKSVIDWVGTKASVSANVDWNDRDSQLFCTMWDILDAHRSGHDYQSIDSCLCCIGQSIDRIITAGELEYAVVDDKLPNNQLIFCDHDLFFICREKPLRINVYSEAAIDPREMPTSHFIDATTLFPQLIGKMITNIQFPDFSEKSNGILGPNFIIELTEGLSLQCGSYRDGEKRKLSIYIHCNHSCSG